MLLSPDLQKGQKVTQRAVAGAVDETNKLHSQLPGRAGKVTFKDWFDAGEPGIKPGYRFLDGEMQIQGLITRRVGRGKNPDKIVTHRHKWTTVTVIHGSHVRGEARKLVIIILKAVAKEIGLELFEEIEEDIGG